MKKILLLAFVSIVFAGCNKDVILPAGQQPAEITTYTNTHFPDNPIIQAIKDKDGFELTYDITLRGGVFLEFNRKKEVTDIQGTAELPASVVPSKLLDFVTTNYAPNYIVGWETDDRNQQIKLDNRIQLEFNMNGDFLRID